MASPRNRFHDSAINRFFMSLVVLGFVGWLSSCQAFHTGIAISNGMIIAGWRIASHDRGVSTIPGARKVNVGRGTIRNFSRKDHSVDNYSNGKNNSFPFMEVALPVVGMLTFWPILALLRDSNDPTSGFDINMFMALQEILNNQDPAFFVGEGIIELPPLSPAERLVDALFGPPKSF